jgi:hypothetical protein
MNSASDEYWIFVAEQKHVASTRRFAFARVLISQDEIEDPRSRHLALSDATAD